MVFEGLFLAAGIKIVYLVNACVANGIPLLYFPAICANRVVAEYLFQHGAEPDATSPDRIITLDGAFIFDQPQMALWLLEHGADPNLLYAGKTHLAFALEKNRIELVGILRSQGGVE